MLPDFLILGAAKSATTALARSLNRHPDISVHPEELHFFSRHHAKGPEWYSERFTDLPPARRLGEKSNTYLQHPEASQRIDALVPEAKLIAILRHPVDRAYSGYCMQFARGKVGDDPNQYLDPECIAREQSPFDFLGQGLYAQHLRRFVRAQTEGRLAVHLFEDLRDKPTELLSSLLRFLDLDPTEAPEILPTKTNAKRLRAYPKLLSSAGTLASRLPGAKAMAAGLARSSLARGLTQRLASRPIHYPPLDPTVAKRMAEFFRPDLLQLQTLLGRDLGPWLR